MDYKEIGKHIKLVRNGVSADEEFLKSYDVELPDGATRLDGINAFNIVAEKEGLHPLVDPKGYMTLDNSVYKALHDTYEKKYTDTAALIDAGVMLGGSYGMKAVLDKLNPVIRHDITKVLPRGTAYSDLRFIEVDDKLQRTIDKFVDERVQLTYSHGIKRSVEADTFATINKNLEQYGSEFAEALDENQSESDVLSMSMLLSNANNDTESLGKFKAELAEPTIIDKDSGDRARASFSTKDKAFAKFLLSNKEYLNTYGFDIVKASGSVTTTWSSEHVDTLYSQYNDDVHLDKMELDMSGLDNSVQQ